MKEHREKAGRSNGHSRKPSEIDHKDGWAISQLLRLDSVVDPLDRQINALADGHRRPETGKWHLAEMESRRAGAGIEVCRGFQAVLGDLLVPEQRISDLKCFYLEIDAALIVLMYEVRSFLPIATSARRPFEPDATLCHFEAKVGFGIGLICLRHPYVVFNTTD